MRYELGNMDMYSVAVMETVMENAAFFKITLTKDIDETKLIESLKKALTFHPLFKCRLVYDGKYYLEENDKDVSKTIKHSLTKDRPLAFGSDKTTNGYLFQICWYGKELSFEWCHAVSDGKGALAFFSKIMDAYYDVDLGEVPKEFPLTLPYEKIFNKNVKPFGQIKQENGFNVKSMPIIQNGYKCTNHVLKLNTSEILAFGKSADSTPASILVPLMCKAIRSHIPSNVKNRNVSCGIVVDGRKPLNIETMHSCIFNKVITYTDRMDKFDLMKQSTLYRSILDVFCQKENLVEYATSMIKDMGMLYNLRPVFLRKTIMKIASVFVKNSMNNIGITYIGKIPFSLKVKENVKDFLFCSWPDIGNCVMAVNDLDGILTIVVSENYKDQGFVDTFIELCKENNIHVWIDDVHIFEQANVRIEYL